MSDAIFIAGYYRSGTSALAGALQRLGVSLHNDAEANEHNPLGFYEIPELIELDVAMFTQLGVDWTDVRGLPPGWSERADMARHLARLDEILRRRFSEAPLWGIKHPHLCRLFPLYERAATQAGHKLHAIHIFRDPWTVASSQHRKNGLARAHALLLWLSYVIAAERHARHLPRSWITYQDLLAEPAVQIRRLEQELGLEFSGRVPGGLKEARSFLTGQLNRSEPLAQANLFRPLQLLAAQVWDAVLSRDTAASTWDGFAGECADLVGFLAEIGDSRGVVIPGFGAAPAAVRQSLQQNALRPAERLDEGAKQRLLKLCEAEPDLPRLHIVIAVPPSRAHAIHDTLESIRGQWHAPAVVSIVSADALDIPGHVTVTAPADAGALTEILCATLHEAAQTADYVAILNAGDTIDPDACLRFALEAARSQAALIYCDEIVPGDGTGWIRRKPGWDVTRLRQAAYLGDWIWYRSKDLIELGGFDTAYAGVEEYDYQLRLSETAAKIIRLPEAVFTRAKLSRRDNIPSTDFGPRAVLAVGAHLLRIGQPATVQPRQHLGLFAHVRPAVPQDTAIILLCTGAQLPMVNGWMNNLLTGAPLPGPIILAGTGLSGPLLDYLHQVHEKAEQLGDKIRVVPPAQESTAGGVLQAALALAGTNYVAILDARTAPVTEGWLSALHSRLADPGVAMVGGRTLLPLAKDNSRHIVQGPIVIGADTRLGAGHMTDDPGVGGWLAVDQEASAIGPVFLARHKNLVACRFPDLTGDAFWINVCLQIRGAGQRIVWTPDVSFVGAPETIRPDPACLFREGAPPEPFEDPYHHPALSLRGDLLNGEQRFGLVRAAPADPHSLLISGIAEAGLPLLNAARALRAAGALEASWAPDHLLPAEILRRDPSSWIRINPETDAPTGCLPYRAVFTQPVAAAAGKFLGGACAIAATSPALVKQLRGLLPPGRRVELWRPALSAPIWQNFKPATGLNTNPRILWIDEGMAPPWFAALINETLGIASWIVVERSGTQYAGAVARLKPPEGEQGWAHELSALAPHILLRPADRDAVADHYRAIMAGAAGCHILVDERLDMPAALGAVALPNRLAAWQRALRNAITGFKATLESGQRTRAACLALPSIEAAPPEWAAAVPAKLGQAAE